ncbi:MAG TPA: helix-turn-helix domain-containing protein [Mycobacterium sp.]|nr:helix-turn-helix domain-containing protein [Mycobacterium sp.]
MSTIQSPTRHRRERRQQHRPELIGLQEAADLCDVSYRTIRRWISGGHLNAVRIGPRLLKVELSAVEALKQPVGGAA